MFRRGDADATSIVYRKCRLLATPDFQVSCFKILIFNEVETRQ